MNVIVFYWTTDIDLWNYGAVKSYTITPVFVLDCRRSNKSRAFINVCSCDAIPVNKKGVLFLNNPARLPWTSGEGGAIVSIQHSPLWEQQQLSRQLRLQEKHDVLQRKELGEIHQKQQHHQQQKGEEDREDTILVGNAPEAYADSDNDEATSERCSEDSEMEDDEPGSSYGGAAGVGTGTGSGSGTREEAKEDIDDASLENSDNDDDDDDGDEYDYVEGNREESRASGQGQQQQQQGQHAWQRWGAGSAGSDSDSELCDGSLSDSALGEAAAATGAGLAPGSGTVMGEESYRYFLNEEDAAVLPALPLSSQEQEQEQEQEVLDLARNHSPSQPSQSSLPGSESVPLTVSLSASTSFSSFSSLRLPAPPVTMAAAAARGSVDEWSRGDSSADNSMGRVHAGDTKSAKSARGSSCSSSSRRGGREERVTSSDAAVAEPQAGSKEVVETEKAEEVAGEGTDPPLPLSQREPQQQTRRELSGRPAQLVSSMEEDGEDGEDGCHVTDTDTCAGGGAGAGGNEKAVEVQVEAEVGVGVHESCADTEAESKGKDTVFVAATAAAAAFSLRKEEKDNEDDYLEHKDSNDVCYAAGVTQDTVTRDPPGSCPGPGPHNARKQSCDSVSEAKGPLRYDSRASSLGSHASCKEESVYSSSSGGAGAGAGAAESATGVCTGAEVAAADTAATKSDGDDDDNNSQSGPEEDSEGESEYEDELPVDTYLVCGEQGRMLAPQNFRTVYDVAVNPEVLEVVNGDRTGTLLTKVSLFNLACLCCFFATLLVYNNTFLVLCF
jgi:hypothetical protein